MVETMLAERKQGMEEEEEALDPVDMRESRKAWAARYGGG